MKRILVLGRFQPPHRGHLDVLETTSKRCDQLIVVVGSAQASYTTDNPFTAGERIEMIEAALRARGVTNTLLIPVMDLHRHAEWVAHVASLVPSFEEVVSNNPLTHELFMAAGYRVRSATLVDRQRLSGTHIRALLKQGKPVDALVDAPVGRLLRRLRATKRIQAIAEDRHA